MAFVTTEIASVELVALTNRTADDGALTDRTSCLTDGNTETNCEELTAGTEGLRIQFSIPNSAVATMTIKFWDQDAMDDGNVSVLPYTDANSVDDSNEVVTALVKKEDCDFVLDASFRGDLGVLGDGTFAIRFVAADGSSAKPKAAEVEYEMTWNTAPLSGYTYDNGGSVLGSQVVQAYGVISTGPLVLTDDPFDSDTSNAVTGVYSLDLYAGDWILIAFDAGSPNKMDISEIITHTV